MLHAMPGAVVAVSGCKGQVTKQQAIQCGWHAAQAMRVGPAPAALSTSNAGGRRLPLHCKGAAPAAAAAAGSNDSCSTCGTTSSLQQQRCSAAPQVVQPDSIASTSYAGRATASNGISRSSRQQQNSIVPCTGTSSRPIGGGSNCSSLEQLGHLGDQQLTGAAIMQQLKAATSWQELQDLVLQHSSQLNWRHSCAAITHAAQLLPQQDLQLQGHQQMHHPPLSSQQQQQEQDPQQRPPRLTATGQPQQQQSQPGTDSQILLEQGSIRQQQQQQLSSSRQSRRPSTGVDAAGAQQFLQLSLMPLINSHLQAYDARGLANCLWALAKLQAVIQPPSTWLQQFCSTSEPLLQQFDAQQLSNTLWGLVQLQHQPPESWMQGWYAAMLQACSLEDPSWQPQSVSSALWSLAQLYGSSEHAGSSSSSSRRSKAGSTTSTSSSSSSSSRPNVHWVDQVLAAAMQRVMQRATSNSSSRGSSKGKQQCGSGQVVSNLLWACVQLQHQPKQESLLALNSWLQVVAAEEAAAAASQLSDQSLANCLWALGKLQQQQQQQHGELQRQHRGQVHPVICQCGQLLLQLSTHRLASTSNQHLSNMVWGAGALHLLVRAPVVSAVMQQLVSRAGSLSDQQLANLMWGLSHIRQRPAQTQQALQQVDQQQPAQPQQVEQQQTQRQQKPQHAECIEHLLSVQAGRLHSFSSQAIGSTLLSLVRLRHHPSQDTLRAWLEPLVRKPPGSSSEVIALVDACCALALLRQQQTPAGSRHINSSGQPYGSSSQWQQRVQMLGPYSSSDAQWLSTVCDVTVSRLGSFTADQLCGLGWALALLRFRAPVPWLTAWQLAVADKASSMTAAVAARVLYVMQELPGVAALSTTGMGAVQTRLADAAVAATVAAAAAGDVAAHDVAAAASCMRAACTTGGMHSMGKLLQVMPAVLSSCSIRQLAVVLSAAAATQAPLQPGLLPSVLQQVQQQQQGHRQHQQCSSICHLLVAVAKVSKQQQFHWQQLQQQQQTPGVTTQADAGSHQQQQDPQQQGSSGLQPHQGQQALLSWLQHSVPQLPLGRASAAELSMVLWALAVLCYHPGRSWLDSWVQHSSSLLQQMAPKQLASCGWALCVLRHRPEPQWLASWSQAVAQHAASGATAPRTLSLLLYSSAVLGCPVSTSWLRSVGLQAARQAEAWGPADVADGLWGLGQLGLRAAAEEELLEVLTELLVAATAGAGQLQQLGPHRQLQVLQAAVLLGPGPLAYQQQQQQQQLGRQAKRLQVSSRQGKRKQKLRWLRFRVLTSAATARQAAAAATADAQSASSSGSSMDGGAGPSRELLAATMGKAAVVSAKYVMAKTGRDPAAGATGPLKPAWFAYWCRCSLQTLAQWRPQQVAAALGAFAALQWPPPLAWQQQMLSQAVQQGSLSVQTATAIQDALVALQSPLVKTWRGSLAVQYIPTTPSSSASPQQQQQQQHEAAALRAVLPKQQQQQQDPAVVKAAVVRSSEPRYPHHLRGNTMRWLYRKQRLMRLVGWWRQQQAIQQQYAQQRQQQQQLEETWQAAAAAQAGTSPVRGSPWSSYESSSYGYSSGSSLGSSGATPSSSIEGAGGPTPASSPPRTPARQLDSSAWGKQLVRPPARPAASAASADVPSPSSSTGSSQANSTTDGSSSESSSEGEQAGAAGAAGKSSSAGGAAAGSGPGGALPAQAAAEQTDSQGQTSDTPASRSSNDGYGGSSSAVGGGVSPVAGPAGAAPFLQAEATTVVPTAWGGWAAVGVPGQAAVGQVAAYGTPNRAVQSGSSSVVSHDWML